MRRVLLLIFWQSGLLGGSLLFADVVTMKDGRQISGVVESGNIQELHIKVGDQSQTVDVHDVQAIQFGVSLPAPPAAPPPPKAADLAPAPLAAAAPAFKPAASTPAPAGATTPGVGAKTAFRTLAGAAAIPASSASQPASAESKRSCQ